MRTFRFRKQADGSVLLNEVHANPSGLSSGTDTETTLLTLTAEEVLAMEHVDDSAPATDPAPKE